MSIVPFWRGINYSGYQRLGALALGYAVKYGATAAYARMALGKRKRPRGRRRFVAKKFLRTQNVKAVVRREIRKGKESKFHYTDQSDTTVPIPVPDLGGIISVPLNAVPAGSTAQARIGKSCKGLRLNINCLLRVGPGAATEKSIRLIVFNYKSPNDIAVTPGEYFDTSTSNYLWTKSLLETFQSNTLYDRTFTLTTASTPRLDVRISLPVPYVSVFDGANPSPLYKNSLHLLAVSDNPTAGNQPLLNYWSEYKFVDM